MKLLMAATLLMGACEADDLSRIRFPDTSFVGHQIDAGLSDSGTQRYWRYMGVRRREVTTAACEGGQVRPAYCAIPNQTIILARGLPLLPTGTFIEPVIQGDTFDLGSNEERKLVAGGIVCSGFRRVLSDVYEWECVEE